MMEFEGVQNYVRVQCTGIDQETGVSSSEPTANLGKIQIKR